MQVRRPFGYDEIVPLYKNSRVRLPGLSARLHLLGRGTQLCRSRGARHVQRREPVSDRSRRDQKGYLPAYVRRYPFCMARVSLDQVEQPDRLIGIEKSYIATNAEEDERMFDDAGGALERWRPIDKLLIIKKDIVGGIYAHLLSLDNFARLLMRQTEAHACLFALSSASMESLSPMRVSARSPASGRALGLNYRAWPCWT